MKHKFLIILVSATSSMTHVEIIDKFADGVVAYFSNSVYQFTKA